MEARGSEERCDITAFVALHAQWIRKLRRTLATRRAKDDPAVVERDDVCDFGHYYHQLPCIDRDSDLGSAVHATHAALHREAARVCCAVRDGSWREVEEALAPNSRLEKHSRELIRLVLAMNRELSGNE
jgi:hypothetical protein